MTDNRELTVLVVSHTHWDREWYHTADRFRHRLVALVGDLLNDPPPAGTSFLLDGQAVLLDDYLAVRPHDAAALGALLRDGRLEAGPWYVLADELIPSGEALVRNLMAGRDTVRRLGGEPPPVLYCPDSFGHPAILPELARGFGFDLVVLWRGYGGARWPAGDTVRWRGPSGTVVTMYHLPPDGYEFGSSLPVDAHHARNRWSRLDDVLRPRAATGLVLLLNGADHHRRQGSLGDALASLAAAAAPAALRPTSLRAAAAAIVGAAAHHDLPLIDGELRDSYGYTWTLGGTLATRAAQKRRNALAERLLLRDVEPWLALATEPAGDGWRDLLHAAWRTLLQAHPHDTLCGTSIDAVAEACDARLASATEQGEALRDELLLRLIGHSRVTARNASTAWSPVVMLRNPAARPRDGVAEVSLVTTLASVAVGPGSATRQGELRSPDLRWLGGFHPQLLSSRRRVAFTEAPDSYPRADLVEEARVMVWAPHMGGYEVSARGGLDPMPAGITPVRATDSTLDNGLLRVAVSASGEVSLTRLGTMHQIPDLLAFDLCRDEGDLYTPAIRERLKPVRFTACDLAHSGPLRGELTLAYVETNAPSHLVVRLRLDAGLEALRLEAEGFNASEDARLRLRIATTAGAGATTIADAAFFPVDRVPSEIGGADASMEHVVPTAPLHRYVSRFGADRGTTIISDGLAEYESLDDGGLAITLLRAVGTLSRHDLPERPGHAGWPADTPGAQEHGGWLARLAVALHGPDGPGQRDQIERLADDVLLPVTGETLLSNLGRERTVGGLELEGDGLAFSAALPARRAGWVTLRCVNRRTHPVQGRWRLARSVAEAVLARLDEMPGEALIIRDRCIEFTAAPMEIVTVLARCS